MKIIVVRKLKDKWSVTTGGGARYRKDVTFVYGHVERKIDRVLASSSDGKTAVKVIYGDGSTNQSVKSADRKYLLYALGCFLEDFLSESLLKRLERSYSNYG